MRARILEYREVVWVDLSEGNGALGAIDPLDTRALEAWVMAQLGPGQIGAGGYGEDRRWYTRSELFRKGDSWRTVHLGIDLWAPAGAAVFAPRDGVIVSAVENAGLGDYGPTLIVKHEELFALYGHLDRSALRWQTGDTVAAGEELARLGDIEVNGHWPPHLHFQLIRALGEHAGDYPGVATRDEAAQYLENCPDPAGFLGLM